ISKHPHAVLLLDEVEKAHPDVFNLLLQVMDHGTLTDNNGRKADFRKVIIVMTTNAGAADMARASIGFTQQDNTTDGMEAIKKLFSPEFRNRLDAVIQFNGLDETTIQRVVDKLLVELETQLEGKRVAVQLDDAARRWIAKTGSDPKMGARPMARVIQENIKRPLAEELLFGKLTGGGTVRVTVKPDDSGLVLECSSASEEPALAKT
ncbi:MAG: AAA family ATPase, partial [Gammaproteobacteria bacterium]